jgi:hypothetical protein
LQRLLAQAGERGGLGQAPVQLGDVARGTRSSVTSPLLGSRIARTSLSVHT